MNTSFPSNPFFPNFNSANVNPAAGAFAAWESAGRAMMDSALQIGAQALKAQEQALASWSAQGLKPEQTAFGVAGVARSVMGDKADELAQQTADFVNNAVAETGRLALDFNKSVFSLVDSNRAELSNFSAPENAARSARALARQASDLNVAAVESGVKCFVNRVSEMTELCDGILAASTSSKSEPAKSSSGKNGKSRRA